MAISEPARGIEDVKFAARKKYKDENNKKIEVTPLALARLITSHKLHTGAYTFLPLKGSQKFAGKDRKKREINEKRKIAIEVPEGIYWFASAVIGARS